MFDEDVDDLLRNKPAKVAAVARKLIRTVQEIRPDFAARVRFGWQSVNFTHPKLGYICAIVAGREHASLVFADGMLLDHPLLTDDGKVVKVRWMPFQPGDEIPVDDIAILLQESIALRS